MWDSVKVKMISVIILHQAQKKSSDLNLGNWSWFRPGKQVKRNRHYANR